MPTEATLTGALAGAPPEFRQLLGDRLFCEEPLVVRASPRPGREPADSEIFYQNLRARNVLAAFVVLGEQSSQRPEDAEHAELQRLESKLDMALELLSALHRSREPDAAAGLVLFNARAVVFYSEQAYGPGAAVDLEVFLLPGWPVPLHLFGHVRTAIEADGRHRIGVRFSHLDTAAEDAFETLVFQRHRRRIAEKRRSELL